MSATQQPLSAERLPPLPVIASATLTLTRYFDVGYAIDLERAQACLAGGARRRQVLPRVRQSSSIQIAEPPVHADLGGASVELEGHQLNGALRASIYDLGAVAIGLSLPLAGSVPWTTVADLFAATQEPPDALERCFFRALEELEALIAPAIQRPERSTLVEDYSVLLIERIDPPAAAPMLLEHPLARSALLGERRVLGADAYATVTGMSYEPEDLALLSWNGALVVEPDPDAAVTLLDLLEFANVELLLLRSYDGALESELSALNERISSARRRLYVPLVGRYNRLLDEAQRTLIEITEVTERIDNAFRVTDDVYWNRLYSAALGVLRVGLWRSELEHRLNLIRESYSMLHGRADSDRAASLEWIIILLILFEIVMALVASR